MKKQTWLNYSMYYLKSDTYQYFQPTSTVSEALRDTSRLYLPLEIDTEFTHPDYDIRHPTQEVNHSITVQIRGIQQSEGLIFVHPDSVFAARHPGIKTGFAPVDYLQAMGHECNLYRDERPLNLPTIQFDLYGFFLTAELYRILQGKYWDDIDRLVRSTDGRSGRIEMGRRLIASTLTSGNKAEQWVYLPWVLEIEGHKLQVALSFYDTCAVHGVANYADFCANSGVKLEYKDTFTKDEKSRMMAMYLERSKDFDNYALGDLYNYPALLGNMDKFRTIYKSLDIENYFEAPRLTIGATVARMFRSKLLDFLGLEINQKNQVIELCRYGTANQFKDYKTTTAVYNAKVDGGRCRNNRPIVASVNKLIADADIAGCYGNGLKHQDYPLGRPIVIDYPIRSKMNKHLTLRQFLKKYCNELVPGLWQARVSTKEGYQLKYGQDFLISWYPPKNPANIPTDTDLESIDWFTEDNIGTTKIFTREVNLALIQQEFLEWLENTCTVRQRKELLDNLVIITASFYPKSERCNTVDQFFEKLTNHKGENTTEALIATGRTKVIKIQQECHAWIGVNLGELLVSRLLEERSKYSKKDPEEKPLNTLYKLCINTIYGDMVSPFFDIGNTIVGNNITARARAMAWYMEKGLHGYQTITDGCAFEVNRVVSGKKDRLLKSEALYEAYVREDTSAFKISAIASDKDIDHYIYQDKDSNRVGLIINGEKLNNYQSLNWLADKLSEHLKEQFPDVPVLDKFKFEIKDLYTSASFHGTANYKFWIGDEEQKGKMRSYRKDGYESYKLTGDDLQQISNSYTPSEEFLTGLRDSPEKLERSKTYLFKKILKPAEYARHYESSWKFSKAFPGCTVESARLLRECSLTQFTFQTKKQFDSWEREQKRLRDKTGQSYESWFIDDDENLNFQEMIEMIDRLIRDGKMRFSSSRSTAKNCNLAREYSDHPEFKCLVKAKHQLGVRYGREELEEPVEEPLIIDVEVIED